jgi:hypothetical protein
MDQYDILTAVNRNLERLRADVTQINERLSKLEEYHTLTSERRGRKPVQIFKIHPSVADFCTIYLVEAYPGSEAPYFLPVYRKYEEFCQQTGVTDTISHVYFFKHLQLHFPFLHDMRTSLGRKLEGLALLDDD